MAKKAKVGRFAIYNEGNGIEFIVAITKVTDFEFTGTVIYVMPNFTFYKVGHTSNDWTKNCEFFKFIPFKKINFLNF